MAKFRLKTRKFTGINDVSASSQANEYFNADFDSLKGEGEKKKPRFRVKSYSDEGEIPVSKDDSIISDINGRKVNPSMPGDPTVVERNDFVQGWGNNPFYFSIDPYVSAPLLTKVQDGIYVGTLAGNRLEYKDQSILLGVTVTTSYPTPVIAIVKGDKVHIFKQTQFTDKVTKTFSENKITNEQEFREYAHNLMQNAHGEDYSPEVTDRVVDGLLKDHRTTRNYGELVGRLQESLGEDKRYSSEGSNAPIVPPNQMPPPGAMPPPPQDPMGPPPPGMGDPSMQQPPMGMDPNMAVGQPGDEMGPPPNPYNFGFNVVNAVPSMETLIGSLAYAPSICHLYHIFSTDYTDHLVLKEFYDKLPDLVDKLAEVYVKDNEMARFDSIVNPEGMDPINYLSNLYELCGTVKATQENSTYTTVIDEIAVEISNTLYKLQRMSEGKKVFSIKSFSDSKLMDQISGQIEEAAVQKFNNGEQPIPDEHFKNKREVIAYVKNKSRNPFDFRQLLDDLLGIGESHVKSGIKTATNGYLDLNYDKDGNRITSVGQVYDTEDDYYDGRYGRYKRYKSKYMRP